METTTHGQSADRAKGAVALVWCYARPVQDLAH